MKTKGSFIDYPNFKSSWMKIIIGLGIITVLTSSTIQASSIHFPVSPNQNNSLETVENIKVYRGFLEELEDITLDPYKSIRPINTPFLSLIYDTLVTFDPVTKEIHPNLAINWAVTPDATEWTFQLRDDVRFHDGTIFNAEAVKFNFDRLINPLNSNYVTSEEAIAYSEVARRLASVEVLDTFLIKMIFSDAYSPLINDLSYYFMTAPSSFDSNYIPIGTGAFIFDFEESTAIKEIYNRNLAYFRGITYIKKIEAEVISLEIFNHQLENQYFHLFPGQSTYVEDPYYKTIINNEAITKWIGIFNFQSPKIQNPNLRYAINHIINQEEYTDLYNVPENYKRATSLNTLFFNETPYINQNSIYYSQDKTLAEEELNSYKEDMGDQFNQTLDIGVFTLLSPIAEILNDQLQELGLSTNILTYDTPRDIIETGNNFDIIIAGFTLAGGFDPADSVTNFLSDSLLNYGNYTSEIVDNLISASIQEPIKQNRALIHEELINQIRNDAPFFNLFGLRVGYKVATDLEDYLGVSYDRKISLNLETSTNDDPNTKAVSDFQVNNQGKYFWRNDLVLHHDLESNIQFSISESLEVTKFANQSESLKYSINPSNTKINYHLDFYFDLKINHENFTVFTKKGNDWIEFTDFDFDDAGFSLNLDFEGDLELLFIHFKLDFNREEDYTSYYVIFSLFVILTGVFSLTYDRVGGFSKTLVESLGKLPLLAPQTKRVVFTTTLILSVLLIVIIKGI